MEVKKMKLKKWLPVLLIFVLAFSMVGCNSQTTTTEGGEVKESAFTGEYIVDVDYVKEHYEDENVILLDARGEEAAKKGTIEGAIATTWQYLSNVENAAMGDYDWGLILEPAELSERLGELGLSKDKEIILFSNGPEGWGEDGRILWTLYAAGYENIKMVDGGINALQAAGLPQTKNVAKLDPVEVEVDELNYEHVINTKELEKDFDNFVIVDVRADEEYEGQVLYGEAQGGRLPGSIHLKYTDFFDEEGYLKSNEEITKLLEDANIQKTDNVVFYCTAGIRSAYAQLISEMLGYNNTSNYVGSYYTWSANNEVEN